MVGKALGAAAMTAAILFSGGTAAAAPPPVSDLAPALRCTDDDGPFTQAMRIAGERTSAAMAVPDTPPKAVIVFAHGYPGTPELGNEFWDQELELRAQRHDAIVIGPAYRGTVSGGTPGIRYGAPIRKASQDLAAVAKVWSEACGTSLNVLLSQSFGAVTGAVALRDHPGVFDAWFADGGDHDLLQTGLKYTPVAPAIPLAKRYLADIARELGGSPIERPRAWRNSSTVGFPEKIAASGIERASLFHGVGEYVLADASVRAARRLRAAGLPTRLRIITTERSEGCAEYAGTAFEAPYRGETFPYMLLGADPAPVTLAGHVSDATWCPLWAEIDALVKQAPPASCATEVAEDYVLKSTVPGLSPACRDAPL